MTRHHDIDPEIRALWSPSNWDSFPHYSPKEIRALADVARRRGELTLAESIERFAACVILPWIGPRFGSVPSRVGVYLREYPLPASAARWDVLPISSGREPLAEDVHRREVQALRSGTCSGYSTLRAAVDAAARVCRQLGCGLPADPATFLDHVVIGDWVKLFALFADRKGRVHSGRASRRSCHTTSMYRFAADAFAREVALLELDLVIVFGRTDARLIERTLGTARTLILPHPRAWHGSLTRAIAALAEDMGNLAGPGPMPAAT